MIREITFGGVVSTLAGSGSPGNTNATGTAASFNGPWGVAVDASSNVYVADEENNLIREIGPGGMVSTLAGKGSPGAHNGAAISAMFYSPMGVAVDSSGNIYIGDTLNQLIREITP
jgi:DNA-binding beta-propeller fold protein YncE